MVAFDLQTNAWQLEPLSVPESEFYTVVSHENNDNSAADSKNIKLNNYFHLIVSWKTALNIDLMMESSCL